MTKSTFLSRIRKYGIVIGIGIIIIISSIIIGMEKVKVEQQTNRILGAKTEMGAATLYVRNLDLVRNFYEQLVGLTALEISEKRVVLGLGNKPIITLEQKDLAAQQSGSAGLYHTAILFSSESELAQSIKTVIESAPETFEGSSDHLVSQAFYFHDPEGNGVELYVDRPRSEWVWEQGRIRMGSYYIDPEEFIARNLKEQSTQPDARMGHVHLRVGNIAEAKEFYVDTLGFNITAEHPGALFVSAGGYHHHLGLNTWESLGAGKRTPSLGLGTFEIVVENTDELGAVKKRLHSKQISFQESQARITVNDPWDNTVVVRVLVE